MATRSRPQKEDKDTSKSRSISLDQLGGSARWQSTNQHKGLHLILLPRWDLIHVDDAGISTGLYAAVLFDCLEDFPSPVAVFFVSCETESQEKGFYCFGTAKPASARFETEIFSIPKDITRVIRGQLVRLKTGTSQMMCTTG